jgi:hypothetical protein
MTTNRRFSMALQALPELRTKTAMALSNPAVGPVSTLSDILAGMGALPPEALFLGIALDGLPVLLNLRDPHPGPMLITGETGSGKTAFLQTIAHSAAQTHDTTDLQFGVLTNCPGEWESVKALPHHVGTFAVGQDRAQEFIHSLTAWAHSNRDTRHYTLLLVDDLESLAGMEPQAVRDFRWLLLRGPARRIWPIVTLNASRYGQVILWLQSFRTRIFGYIANERVAAALGGDNASVFAQLEARTQFALREKENWLRFWLPSC